MAKGKTEINGEEEGPGWQGKSQDGKGKAKMVRLMVLHRVDHYFKNYMYPPAVANSSSGKDQYR